MDLLERLKHSGQAILCTVHQPSAMLFQRFDRLLFLAKGGKTVYFGDIGHNSGTLTTYFEGGGAPKCPPEANPAEWMLEVIGAAPGAETNIDWPSVWRESKEYKHLQAHLDSLEASKRNNIEQRSNLVPDQGSLGEFATSFTTQMRELLVRIFKQLWRTPTYIYSKFALCFLASLFVGFVFYDAPATHQGLQNQMFSIFMLLTIQGQITQQIMPHFVTQRSLYEVRERPSRCYSWQAFIASNILVELPWNALMAVIIFLCFYFPVGMQHNAAQTDAIHERAGLFFFFVLGFLMFTSTFTHLVIAGIPNAEGGGTLSNLVFMLCLIFCGVLATPEAMPGFWIFMYRVSPYTYLVSGLLSTGLGRAASHCAENEFVSFNAPSNTTCAEFVQPFAELSGGYLRDPDAAQNCSFCSYSETDVFLDQIGARYSERWRNLGILWVYVLLNVPLTFAIYWLARVPKASRTKAAV